MVYSGFGVDEGSEFCHIECVATMSLRSSHKEREERGGGAGDASEDEAARAAAAARDTANAVARTAFHGVISSVFTKHLRWESLFEDMATFVLLLVSAI